MDNNSLISLVDNNNEQNNIDKNIKQIKKTIEEDPKTCSKLNNEQLEELTNKLKLMNIDNEEIKKIVKKLKIIKKEVLLDF
jgi:Glu-tRNA(Gln) amidotransferase subunit E-like FAD-binding protein